MRRLTAAKLTGALGFLVGAGATWAQQPAGTRDLPYSNTELGFAMTLPAGFLREGEDPLNLRSIACFVSPSVADQRAWVRICVERQGGALPRRARRMSFTWKGLDLDGAVFESEWARQAVVVYGTLVPLRKEPVWLVAMSPLADRGHAQAALVSTLASFQGESAQLSRTERAERAGRTVGLVASILIAVGAGMWIARRRRRQ